MSLFSGTKRELSYTIKQEFDSASGVVRLQWSGDVTLGLLELEHRKFRERANLDEIKALLVDFTDVQHVRLSNTDITFFSQGESPFPPGFPRVFVAGRDFHYGMLRMYEMLAGARRAGTTVARSLAEAYEVLQLKDPKFEPWE